MSIQREGLESHNMWDRPTETQMESQHLQRMEPSRRIQIAYLQLADGHRNADDDDQPLVDVDNSTLIPWQEGTVYSEAQYHYLSAFASAYREARKALQHTKTGRDYKVVGRFKSSKVGFRALH